MRITIRPVIIFILVILSSPRFYGQGQARMVDYLTDAFNDYVEAIPREELYIHTDRKDYIAGENIWMKIYLFDRKSMKPSDRSRIAYVEILNSDNKPVLQKRFAMYKGNGIGQLQLPDTLASGDYSLRAYTNWMKNFLPYNCFLTSIRIYNATANEGYLRNAGPEQYAKPTNSSNGNSMNSGSGISIETRKPDNNYLDVTICTDDNFYKENGDQLYLFIQTHGNIDTVTLLKIRQKETSVLIPVAKLTPGINQITVFNSQRIPVAEKYILTPQVQTSSLDISVEGTCKTREKMTLKIKTGVKLSSTPVSASLSTSIIPVPGSSDLTGIEDYLVLGTEFTFQNQTAYENLTVHDTALTDNVLQNIRSNWIDWGSILAGNLPDLAYKTEYENHFLSGRLEHELQTASMHSEKVLLCTPGRYPEFQHSETDSTGKFTFSLHIDEELKDLIIMPDDESIRSKILLESSFSEKYYYDGIAAAAHEEFLPFVVGEMIVNQQVRRIYGIPDNYDTLKPLFTPLRQVRFYGKPDIELILDYFVALPEMEEVFFELLPKVSLKKRDKNFEIMIADRIYDDRYELFPYLFLDGVKIRDASVIANLSPSDVEKIDVIKEGYAIGDYFFPGIVNVITKKADFSSIQLPDYMIRFPYRVVEPALAFPMPEYSSADQKNSPIPDFRNTLYWNPSVILDKEGKAGMEFWTCDLPGKYKIVLQGTGLDGQFIYKEMIISIE